MKKRNKKYRQKRTHAPSFIYSLTLGELTEGDRARADIHPYAHLDVLRRGRVMRRTHGTSSPHFATRGS